MTASGEGIGDAGVGSEEARDRAGRAEALHLVLSSPDRSLLRLLAQAHQFRALVRQGGGPTIGALAAAAEARTSYFTRILGLGFLAPDVLAAILQGRQPAELSAR